MEKQLLKANFDVYQVGKKRVCASTYFQDGKVMAWEENQRIENFVEGNSLDEAIILALEKSLSIESNLSKLKNRITAYLTLLKDDLESSDTPQEKRYYAGQVKGYRNVLELIKDLEKESS